GSEVSLRAESPVPPIFCALWSGSRSVSYVFWSKLTFAEALKMGWTKKSVPGLGPPAACRLMSMVQKRGRSTSLTVIVLRIAKRLAAQAVFSRVWVGLKEGPSFDVPTMAALALAHASAPGGLPCHEVHG